MTITHIKCNHFYHLETKIVELSKDIIHLILFPLTKKKYGGDRRREKTIYLLVNALRIEGGDRRREIPTMGAVADGASRLEAMDLVEK